MSRGSEYSQPQSEGMRANQRGTAHTHAGDGETISITHSKLVSFLFMNDHAAAQRVLCQPARPHREALQREGRISAAHAVSKESLQAANSRCWSIGAFKELHVASSSSQHSTTGGWAVGCSLAIVLIKRWSTSSGQVKHLSNEVQLGLVSVALSLDTAGLF